MIQPFTLYLVAALIGALAVAVLALAIFLPQAAAVHLRSESKTESELQLSSLAARVPISEIRDGLIVRRDGSFCAGWECSGVATQFADAERLEAVRDRKSTRLNSSHGSISYAVFCLKKKI